MFLHWENTHMYTHITKSQTRLSTHTHTQVTGMEAINNIRYLSPAVVLSCYVMSNSLWPRGLQHARLPCPSPSPGVCPSSCSLLSSHLILCCPILLLPSIFPNIRDFSNKSSVHIRWPKYWSFSFSISPSGEYSGLISIEIDWFDFLEVQGTFRSLLQDHSSKASILWHSAFFMVQFSQLYVTTGKTIALSIRTFVNRVLSLLFSSV